MGHCNASTKMATIMAKTTATRKLQKTSSAVSLSEFMNYSEIEVEKSASLFHADWGIRKCQCKNAQRKATAIAGQLRWQPPWPQSFTGSLSHSPDIAIEHRRTCRIYRLRIEKRLTRSCR